MRQGLSKILVTGGAGFIGSAFVKLVAKGYPRNGMSVVVVDRLTYAGDLERLREVKGRFKFYKEDICNRVKVGMIFRKENPDTVINFAAESHVDRSILDAKAFLETNVRGTHILLEAARKYKIKRFIQVSSDEVYGQIAKGKFSEDSPLNPSSPYAASKAAADLLIKACIRTYNFPAIIIRPCNNYGPWQYPEKLIPLAVLKILRQQKVPLYARGKNIREWLYVDDCAKGIMKILEKGKIGQIYNLGSNEEKQNIDVVKSILKILRAPEKRIEFVKDRPGHDLRYSLDSRKTCGEIGWNPEIKFEEGIEFTVRWSLEHKNWLFSKHKDIVKLYGDS